MPIYFLSFPHLSHFNPIQVSFSIAIAILLLTSCTYSYLFLFYLMASISILVLLHLSNSSSVSSTPDLSFALVILLLSQNSLTSISLTSHCNYWNVGKTTHAELLDATPSNYTLFSVLCTSPSISKNNFILGAELSFFLKSPQPSLNHLLMPSPPLSIIP